MKVVQLDDLVSFGDVPQRGLLVETEELRVMYLSLRAGQQLPAHKAPSDLTLHCLRGRGRFNIEDRVVNLQPGVLVHLPRQVEHSVTAEEDLVCLQVLSPNPRRTAAS